MRRTLLAIGLVGVLASSAFAEELTAAEKTWARSCVTGLTAASPRQRDSAAAALAKMGIPAIGAVLPALTALKNEEQWEAFRRSLVAMGAKEALAEIEKRAKEWPGSAA